MRSRFLLLATCVALATLLQVLEASSPANAKPIAKVAVPTATKWWYSGFEDGFPGPRNANQGKGEWLNYSGKHSPTSSKNSSGNAWSIQHRNVSRVPPFKGDYVFMGEIFHPAAKSHRAYPVVVLPATLTKPIVNSFMVYLDTDYAEMAKHDWISFSTWSNGWWAKNGGLHTISVVQEGMLETAHMDKQAYVGPRPQPAFPLRKWVRLTWCFYPRSDNGNGDGTVLIWQDGTLVFRGVHLAKSADQATFHWGMYAKGSVKKGALYNDEIQIWTLSGPWPDATQEPPSPYNASKTTIVK